MDQDDSLLEQCSSGFKLQPQMRMNRSELQCKIDARDEMAELICLQKSNGLFEISNKEWIGSVLEKYLGARAKGSFENVLDSENKSPRRLS